MVAGERGVFQVVERSLIRTGVVVTRICTTVKANQNIHLESVHFMVYKLYLIPAPLTKKETKS